MIEVFHKLQSNDYEHPFDKKALELLKGTPGLEPVCKAIITYGYERIISTQYMGSCLKVNSSVCPEIFNLLTQCCKTLNIQNIPDLYIQLEYGINAFTIGLDKPIIVINSGAVDLLTEKEQIFLIGHELGHIKSQHMLYHMLAELMETGGLWISQATLGLGSLISFPLQSALYYWSRMSEFTADRAGLLACQDISSVASIMMKMSGLPTRFYGQLSPEAFIEQAKAFQALDYETLNLTWRVLMQLNQTHPWTVMRTEELIRWMNTEQYKHFLSENYWEQEKRFFQKERKFVCQNCGCELVVLNQKCRQCGSELNSVILDR